MMVPLVSQNGQYDRFSACLLKNTNGAEWYVSEVIIKNKLVWSFGSVIINIAKADIDMMYYHLIYSWYSMFICFFKSWSTLPPIPSFGDGSDGKLWRANRPWDDSIKTETSRPEPTGNHIEFPIKCRVFHGFPVKFPLNQSIECWVLTLHVFRSNLFNIFTRPQICGWQCRWILSNASLFIYHLIVMLVGSLKAHWLWHYVLISLLHHSYIPPITPN